MTTASGPPRVSVIVVNWNGESYVSECVDSLLAQTYPRLEILVVDNGSTDGSVPLLRERYGGKIRVIVNRENRGFAGGNNDGMAEASGDYVALINNDATADSGWVAALVCEAERDVRVGMCASKIISHDDPTVIDSAGLLLARDGLGRGRGRLERDDGRFDRSEEVLVPSGCAALYRRAMLAEIGTFDERFFMYCEDIDLGLRARLAGWRCRYAPDAVVRHRYSLSAGKYSLRKVFLVERNRVWVMVKSFPWSALALSPLWTIARLIWQTYAAVSGQGAAGRAVKTSSPWALVRMVGRAYLAALRGAPAMWRARRRDRSGRIAREEVHRWLRDHGVTMRDVVLRE
ncbi:MAG: glycosyltransferase family 2 protein [Nitrospirota bacterium]